MKTLILIVSLLVYSTSVVAQDRSVEQELQDRTEAIVCKTYYEGEYGWHDEWVPRFWRETRALWIVQPGTLQTSGRATALSSREQLLQTNLDYIRDEVSSFLASEREYASWEVNRWEKTRFLLSGSIDPLGILQGTSDAAIPGFTCN